jgi:uncharacterized phage-associated protein
MPHHDPRTIANALIAKYEDQVPDRLIMNLVFMANGWNLATAGKGLIVGPFLASDSGPAAPLLRMGFYEARRDMDGALINAHGQRYAADLEPDEAALLDKVFQRYGGLTSAELSSQVMSGGTPWSNAYFGAGRGKEIDHIETRDYFERLALAGRAPEPEADPTPEPTPY